MKIYNGLIRIFGKAKFDQLSKKTFQSWKGRAENFYSQEETIWKQFCRIEKIDSTVSYEEFCIVAKTKYSDR